MTLLTTEEAAKRLSVKPGTLEVWRCHGRGPKFVKVGRSVRYPEKFLDEFLNNNVVEFLD